MGRGLANGCFRPLCPRNRFPSATSKTRPRYIHFAERLPSCRTVLYPNISASDRAETPSLWNVSCKMETLTQYHLSGPELDSFRGNRTACFNPSGQVSPNDGIVQLKSTPVTCPHYPIIGGSPVGLQSTSCESSFTPSARNSSRETLASLLSTSGTKSIHSPGLPLSDPASVFTWSIG